MFPEMGLAGEGVGLVAQGVGAYMGYQAQQGISQANQNIAQDQKQIQVQNEAQMRLNASRARMEAFRNNQRARALALNSAAGQGAQFGSGLQGAYGQITGQTNTNVLGINQNLKIGEAVAQYNQDISNQQMALAKYQSQASTAAGISSLGSGAFNLGQGLVSYGTPTKYNPGAPTA